MQGNEHVMGGSKGEGGIAGVPLWRALTPFAREKGGRRKKERRKEGKEEKRGENAEI